MRLSEIQKIILPLLFLAILPAAAPITQLDVLVVDDGHQLGREAKVSYEEVEGMFRDRYRDSLGSIEGVNVDFTNTSGAESGPSYNELSGYDAVVWFTLADTEGTGPGSETFTSEDEENLERYMQDGGSVYVTGHRLEDVDSKLQGPGSFFRDYFSVRFRDQGDSAKYWRINYQQQQGKPNRWLKQEVYTDKVDQVDYPPYNTFDRLGNVYLEGNGKITSGLGFKLNTSIEPPSSVGVITDNCLHEEESNQSEDYDSYEDGEQGLENCEGFADDSMNYVNKFLIENDPDNEVQIDNINSKRKQGVGSITVDYSSDSGRSVVLAVANLNPGNSTRIEKVTHDNSGRILHISQSNSSDARLNTYLIKGVENDGEFDINAANTTNLTAMTVTVKQASKQLTAADLKTRKKPSRTISSSVKSGVKDRVLSFLISTEQTEADDAKKTKKLGSNGELVLKTVKAEETGTTTISHTGGENYIQTLITISNKLDKEKRKRPQYFVETDGGRLTSKFENLEKEGRKCTQWVELTGSEDVRFGEEGWLDTGDVDSYYDYEEEKSFNEDVGWKFFDYQWVYLSDEATIRSECDSSATDFPDERSASFVNSYGVGYRTAFSSIGFESIARPSKRKEFMERTVRFLTGPVGNRTSIKSGDNIPGTPVDESRYTNSTVQIDSVGLNLQHNPNRLIDARFSHDLALNGLEQPYSSGFEDISVFSRKWEMDDTTDIYGGCGARFGENSVFLGNRYDLPYLKMEEGEGVDISKDTDLEFKFWFRPSECVEGADEDVPLNLFFYDSSEGAWDNVETFNKDNYDSWGSWHSGEVPVPEKYQDSGFRVKFESERSDGFDGYLIDDISLDKPLPAEDGKFTSLREPVSKAFDASQVSEVQQDSEGDGKNITFALQFKDNSRQGYWGPLTERWMQVDVEPPDPPEDVEPSERYTNSSKFNLTVSYQGDTQGYRADLVRFSCEDGSSWSEWENYNDSKTTQEFSVAVNSTKNGCGTDQGNKTVKVDVRDYAGNKAPSDGETWIVYDTDAPDFQGAKPENDSAVPGDPSVNITATDENSLPDSFGSEDVSLYNILKGGRGQFLVNQTFDVPLEKGMNNITARIYDKASNVNKTRIRYDKDVNAPRLNVTLENERSPSNNTVLKPIYSIEIEVFDRNFDRLVANVNSGPNLTFESNDSYNPNWNEGISETLNVWLNDTAGNAKYFRYNYSVDGSAPQLSGKEKPENTYIKPNEELRFNFSDTYSSVQRLNASRNWYKGEVWDMVVEPSWDTGLDQKIDLNATDAAGGEKFTGNKLETSVTYDVDGVRPETSINYTRSDAPESGWFQSNVSLELNASDNMELSTINYSVEDADAPIYELAESSENNLTVQIGCEEGKICEKVLVRKAFDKAGNPSSQEISVSDKVSIDKKAPEFSIDAPPNGTVSENISIDAENVRDPGVGIQKVEYEVLNRSDKSKIDSGELTSPGFETEWDSEDYIEGTEKLTLKMTAEDKFSHTTVKERDFTVENERTTVTINSPSSPIVGKNFTLDVEAARPGTGDDLAEHNLSIRKQGGETFYSRSDDISGENNHQVYEEDFNVSKLGEDGDYVVNTSAKSEGGENASSNHTFYLDTTPPNASINRSLNQSWVTGTINLEINASDEKKKDTITIQYRNKTSGGWKFLREREDFSTAPVTFNTEENCQDTSETSCGVRIKASDSAGNVNTSFIGFKVDNSPPNISIDSPEKEAWLKESFTVERTVTDNVLPAEQLVCEVSINGAGFEDRTSCAEDFTVQVPDDCSEADDSYCRVETRASHPELELENTTTRRLRIDTSEPEIFSGPTPAEDSYLNGSEEITVGYTDEISSISHEKYDDGSKNQLESKQPFEPSWTKSGQKTLEIVLNDSADNLRTEEYSYIFDNKAPELRDSNLSVKEDSYTHARVYRAEDISVNVNVSENIRMKKAWVKVSHDSNEWNRTLSLDNGTREKGLWTANLANDTLGLYSVEKIYLEDMAGNRTVKSPSSLDFKVVTFDADVELGSNTQITAGNQTDFTYTINFNRTAGERNLTLELPGEDSSLLDLTGLNCDNIDQSNCQVIEREDHINLIYNGSQREVVDLVGDAEASTPDADITDSFVTFLQSNTEQDDVTVRAPLITLENSSCSRSCTVNQSESFNLTFDLMNNGTSSNSGTAIDVESWLDSDKLDENRKDLGNLVSGETRQLKFENLSIGEVGQHQVRADVEDVTGSYNSENTVQIDIKDSEPPQAGSLSLSDDRINVNDSISFSSRLTDNVGVENANVTLDHPNGTQYNVSLSEPTRGNRWSGSFSVTEEDGIYSVEKIEVVDQRGNRLEKSINMEFEVTRLQINVSITSETMIDSGEVANFSVNVSGNSSELRNIVMNVTSPGVGEREITYRDVKKENNFTFDDLRNSGNHTFTFTANAAFDVSKNTSDVFVKYGDSNVSFLEPLNGSKVTIPEDPEGSEVSIDWNISTFNGSIAKPEISGSTTDSGIIQYSEGDRTVENLTDREGERIVETTVDPLRVGQANLTLDVIPRNGTSSSAEIPVKVVSDDNEDPELENLSVTEKELNLEESLKISAKADDNTLVKNVTVKLERPTESGSTVERFLMNRSLGRSYSLGINSTDRIGQYNITAIAFDYSGNSNTSTEGFNVTDNYTVSVIPDQEEYVKSEYIDMRFRVEDASGEELNNGYNITAKMEKGGDNTTMVNSTDVKDHSFFIEDEYVPYIDRDPDNLPMNYTVYINASRDGNIGSTSKNIKVTRVLNVFIDNKEFVAPGEEFQVRTSWTEPQNDPIRGDLNAYVLCEACPSEYKPLVENVETGFYEQTLTAPNSTDTYSFKLRGSAYGNSESQDPEEGTDAAPFSTFEVVPEGEAPTDNSTQDEGGLPSGGFGGGGGGGPTMEITRISPDVSVPSSTDRVNLSVNTNIAATCVYSRNSIPDQVSFNEASEFQNTGGVTHSKVVDADSSITYSYDIMCVSDNANSTQSIVFSKGEVDVTSFRIPSFPGSLTPGNETVSQGENITSGFVVENNMSSETLNLEFEYEPECCEGFVMRDGEVINEAEIDPQGSREFTLGIDVPLSAEEGTYRPTLLMRTENSSQPPKRRQPNFRIVNSGIISSYKQLMRRSQILNSSIERYDIAGVDTSRERELLNEVLRNIEKANRSISNDNITGLRRALDTGYESAERIDSSLQDEAWKKYWLLNWWKWALGFVIVYIMFFLVTVVGIPYYRIQTELVRIESELEDQVEARKKGEKQYFKRQIDKDTFNSMMQDRQNEILELRGEEEDLKEELDGFLWNKLTLENYLKAPWKGMSELEKWWAANRRARQNLNSDSEGDDEE